MSYWVAFGVGIAVGVVAALVRRAMAFPPLRPPPGWINNTISLALTLLPGVVVGALAAASFVGGLLVWIGSLLGGVLSLWLPEYLPEDTRAYRTASEQLYVASSAGDKETAIGFLDSQDTSLRSWAVSIIRRREWREFTPELVRRVGVEQDKDIRGSLASALASFADPATGATLAAFLDDDSEMVRRIALLGLSRIGDSRVPSAAKATYETGGYFARTQAVWCLLVLGTPVAEATLQDLIATQPSWIRRRQAKAVIRRFRKDVAHGKSV